jgi:LacI family transcriptional regulator
VAHLASLGHETIGFISGPLKLPSARARREAFLESLGRAGMRLKKDLIVEGNHRIDGGRMAMEQLLQLPERPTAILASNDLTAIGAIGSIHQHQLHVPKDISVIGFDDIEISASLYPPLTTVRLSRAQIADRAFHALFTASREPGSPGAEYMVQPELVVRETTAVRAKVGVRRAK